MFHIWLGAREQSVVAPLMARPIRFVPSLSQIPWVPARWTCQRTQCTSKTLQWKVLKVRALRMKFPHYTIEVSPFPLSLTSLLPRPLEDHWDHQVRQHHNEKYRTPTVINMTETPPNSHRSIEPPLPASPPSPPSVPREHQWAAHASAHQQQCHRRSRGIAVWNPLAHDHVLSWSTEVLYISIPYPV